MTPFAPLRNFPLFTGIGENQMEALFRCLKPIRRTYRKDEFVFVVGDRAATVGVVVSGGVRVLLEDADGQRTILTHVGPGAMFGEAFSCTGDETLPISVTVSDAADILLIDYRKVMTTCASSCDFHGRMLMNMLRILAENTIVLTRKIEHISKRTTREKLLSFLTTQAALHKEPVIEIPFNRQELADYLCVDRSALSREIGAMRREGILRYEGKRFELLRE